MRVDGELVTRFAVGDADAVGQMAPLSFAGNIAGDPDWEYYMNTGDSHLEVRFPAKAGQRTVGVSFVRRLSEREGVLQPRNRGYGRFVDERYDEDAAVEQVAIGGPYSVEGPGDTPSRRQIFVCTARFGRRGRRGGSLRPPDSRQAGPPGVSPARRRQGHRGIAGLLPRRAARRRLRRRHPVRAGTDAGRPRGSCSASSAIQ